MSNTMTAHEPIKYLDSVLNEEERRCEYSHEWRNFTISRSGRFKSKNKKRDTVDRKLFDASSSSTATTTIASVTTAEKMSASIQRDDATNCGWKTGNSLNNFKAQDTMPACYLPTATNATKDLKSYQQPQPTTNKRIRDKASTYKSYYETNL